MKIFVPRLSVACIQPPQTKLIPNLGGLPWGFPVDTWPVCRECGSHMALLAQLPHDASVGLDLGDKSYVLHLFQCPVGGCSSYAYDEGCTASLILHCEDLGNDLTHPADIEMQKTNPYVAISRSEADGSKSIESFPVLPLNGEFWITGWDEFEDGIEPSQSALYYDEVSFEDASDEEREPYRKLASTEESAFRFRTKTGGFPYWGWHGAQPPQGNFEFLLQLDTFISIDGPLPEPKDLEKPNAPWEMQQNKERNGFTATFANFGTDGAAYIFIDRTAMPPNVIWAWSR